MKSCQLVLATLLVLAVPAFASVRRRRSIRSTWRGSHQAIPHTGPEPIRATPHACRAESQLQRQGRPSQRPARGRQDLGRP